MTRRIAAVLVALALAFPLPALAQGGDLRAEIGKMDQAWQAAFNAGDAAALAALYTHDARVAAPGSEPVAGPTAIKAYFAAQMATGAKNTLTSGEVVGFGDFALEIGSWQASSADGRHLDHGTFTTLFKKVDGAWKIHRDTWNSSMAQ